MGRQFLDEIDVRLRRRGLPPRYVDRVLAELHDHYDALHKELQHEPALRDRSDDDVDELARQRLAADPDALIERIVATQQRGIVAVARRHPFITFALAPIPLMLAIGFLIKLVGVWMYGVVVNDMKVPNMHPALVQAVDKSFLACAYGVTPLLALGFCRLGWRSGFSPLIPLVSCALLSAAGGVLLLDLVQCAASQHVAYFQRWGIDATRLALPLAVFAVHTVWRAVRGRVAELRFG